MKSGDKRRTLSGPASLSSQRNVRGATERLSVEQVRERRGIADGLMGLPLFSPWNSRFGSGFGRKGRGRRARARGAQGISIADSTLRNGPRRYPSVTPTRITRGRSQRNQSLNGREHLIVYQVATFSGLFVRLDFALDRQRIRRLFLEVHVLRHRIEGHMRDREVGRWIIADLGSSRQHIAAALTLCA